MVRGGKCGWLRLDGIGAGKDGAKFRVLAQNENKDYLQAMVMHFDRNGKKKFEEKLGVCLVVVADGVFGVDVVAGYRCVGGS